MKKRYWRIDVPMCDHGYSFAIACDGETSEDAIEAARKNNLFEEDFDSIYASAEDITDDDYEMRYWSNHATVIQ